MIGATVVVQMVDLEEAPYMETLVAVVDLLE
jgi:hypothetical protein